MLSVLLATAGLGAAAYEWWAVKTGRAPTISELVKQLPVPARVALVAFVAATLADHLITRWVL